MVATEWEEDVRVTRNHSKDVLLPPQTPIHRQFIQSLPFYSMEAQKQLWTEEEAFQKKQPLIIKNKAHSYTETSCQMQHLSHSFWVSLHHSHTHFRGLPSCSTRPHTNTKFYWCVKSVHSKHFLKPRQYGIVGEGKRGRSSVNLFLNVL